ncbi:MAG: chromatin protein Cren7, partial [Desulfurococcales archaeon]|nr:chromatin protein Cren7 [Desulfurococcales archaeon]
MPRRRKKRDPFVCPRCGTRVSEPVKTWTIVSPIPDKYGRITVTIMGSFV